MIEDRSMSSYQNNWITFHFPIHTSRRGIPPYEPGTLNYRSSFQVPRSLYLRTGNFCDCDSHVLQDCTQFIAKKTSDFFDINFDVTKNYDYKVKRQTSDGLLLFQQNPMFFCTETSTRLYIIYTYLLVQLLLPDLGCASQI